MNNILDLISEHYSSFTRSQKLVANYISDNLSNVAFCTLEDLAPKIGVSTTTLIRFARAVGYSGYSELQQEIQTSIIGKSSLPNRYSTATSNIHPDQLLLDSFQTDIENINETLAHLDRAVLDRTVSSIVDAKTVYTLGMRGAFSLAHITASRLGQIRENVRLIQAIGDIYPEEIGGAGKGDLCIAYMFPRYSKMTAKLVHEFKNRGVFVIIITSMQYEPIKTYGDIIIPCAIKSISFKSSFTAPLCLINYLIAAIAMKDKSAEQVVQRTEQMLNQGFYLGL